MDQAAREVCHAYAVTQGGFQLHALGNAGGFSGARLWRVETFGGNYCLKAWPRGSPSQKVLQYIHELMIQAARGLTFVPTVMTAADGRTWRELADRNWELTRWMPGKADFHDHPTLTRLRAAVHALAKLHRAWGSMVHRRGPCPGVYKRLDRLNEGTAGSHRSFFKYQAVPRGFEHKQDLNLAALSKRAWDRYRQWAPLALRVLEQKWKGRETTIQDCLRDVWHDHIFFDGHLVTAIIDYGGVADDCVATGLARLLGSLIGDDAAQRDLALDAYQEIHPLEARERELVSILDWTGVVVGVGNWLRWLYLEGRQFEDQNRVVQRLSELVTRMEGWKEDAHGAVGLVGV